ncbi:YveK family protein [Gordonia hankookensis]|uniref:Capsular polysaccharide biosynthesis protein n=1 Tax=Gordonia hankookensis TaxID=589403 RepID=A0ABR7W881_9ACTN|nr:hypothetical protein [Gordonia hankookensis]MBD1319025.1 hypothetical protein [Gordonia hankookensis]
MISLLSTLVRRWPLVLACGLVAFLIPMLISITAADSYRATTRLFVATTAKDVTSAYQGTLAAQARIPTYLVLATGPELMNRAAQQSGEDITGAELARTVTVSSAPGTVLIDVSATADSAQSAARRAQAVADELLGLVSEAEKPIDGAGGSIGLLILQPAAAGIEKIPAIDPLKVAIFTIAGLAVGVFLALVIPARFRLWPSRSRRPRSGQVSDDRPSNDALADNESGDHPDERAVGDTSTETDVMVNEAGKHEKVDGV